MTRWPNRAAPGNGSIAVLFDAERPLRAVPEPHRSGLNPMKLVALVMFFVLAVAASCSSPPVESMPVTMNTLESVESKQVMYDGEPWIEVAIGLAAFLLES